MIEETQPIPINKGPRPIQECSSKGVETMKRRTTIGLVIFGVIIAITCTQLTLFVIPPIGAVPKGRTVVIVRLNGTEFIDSPDAMCERIQGGVSLLCRGMIMGSVLDKATILARMPYSSSLYGISTGGIQYDR